MKRYFKPLQKSSESTAVARKAIVVIPSPSATEGLQVQQTQQIEETDENDFGANEEITILVCKSYSSSSANNNSQNRLTKYEQKYLSLWQTEYKWAQKSKKGECYVYCNLCFSDLYIGSMGKSILTRHLNSQHHQKNISTCKLVQTTLESESFYSLQNRKTDASITFAVFIAEHNLSFNLMDHFPGFLASVSHDSELCKQIKCSRTKVVAILKNVLGLTYMEDVTCLLNRNKFSLIANEATDISLCKTLCLVVRVRTGFSIKDFFFDLIPVEKADADSLYASIINCFYKNSINYVDNLIGFAADGANVMTGRHHSVASLLKKDIKNIFLLKCVCHSFHLCASYACEKLPNSAEELARNIYNYLKSSKRLRDFEDLQVFFEIKPHKIMHPSQTRWLSLLSVVSRLLSKYEVLKAFFSIATKEDKFASAMSIFNMLNDPIIKLYLMFLEFALPFFNNLNKLFQAESPKLYSLYYQIKNITISILECFIKKDYIKRFQKDLSNIDYLNSENFLDLKNLYLGPKVNLFLLSNQVDEHRITTFKLNCREFYTESIKQIFLRFNFESTFFQNLEVINPENIIKKKFNSISCLVNEMPHLVPPDKIQLIDNQYRMLSNFILEEDKPLEIEAFWQKVGLYKINNDQAFPELINFVYSLLSLPHSSVNVERIFSQVKLIKTAQRNRLDTSSIRVCLQTKGLLKMQGSNCMNFKPTKEMRNKFNVNMYND